MLASIFHEASEITAETGDGGPLSWDNGSCKTPDTPPERNTVLVNTTTPAARFEVTCDMDGLTSRAGTVLLSGLCDTTGLTDGLLEALSVHSRSVRHKPGRIVRDLAVMLADGGDCLTDLGALRNQGALFGQVASDATAYRCVERLDARMLARLRETRAAARARAWDLGGAPSRVILDIDATLVTAHSAQGARRRELQGRLWLPPAAVLRGHHRRGALRSSFARATPEPTPPQTTSRCSTVRWPSCLRASRIPARS